MLNATSMTMEEMRTETGLFRSVYPDLIGEIDRVEKTRGKLNDFQLMMAVSYAKNGLGVLNYERRQTINSVFAAFTVIYRQEGRDAAAQWAWENFGCEPPRDGDAAGGIGEEVAEEVAARLEELSTLIRHKETELLKMYREYHMLQDYIAKPSATEELAASGDMNE